MARQDPEETKAKEAVQADLELRRVHPDSRLRETMKTTEQWAIFSQEIIDRSYWAFWCDYFDNIFREKPSVEQRRAILVELRRRGFTNVMLRDSADFIIRTRRQWPFVSDFLDPKNDAIPDSVKG